MDDVQPVVIRATREVIEVPMRFEGQEYVPLKQLRRTPRYIIHGELEITSSGETEEEALAQFGDLVADLSNGKIELFLVRVDNYLGGQVERPGELVEVPVGRDKAQETEVVAGDRPDMDGDGHPSPRHLTGYEGRTQPPSYARGGAPQGRKR